MGQFLPLPRRNIDIRFTSINRTTRVVQLTSEGALLLDQITPAMTAIGQALDSLNNAEKEVRGTLRVTGPTVAYSLLLERHVADFLRPVTPSFSLKCKSMMHW